LSKPIIAIVGRPNVGKSTLFNRIIRKNRAVIHNSPGVTRDRIYADTEFDGKSFTVVDTGGLDLYPKDNLITNVKSQVDKAVKEADAVIMVVDVADGITSWDMGIADSLRKASKPVYVAANKADNPARIQNAPEFHVLALGDPFPVSAMHGSGVNELLEEILWNYPKDSEENKPETGIKIAVVGRPNVGKSSLVNVILGEERVIVDSRPGTTRDSVNIAFSKNGVNFEIVDTAGMKKKMFDDIEMSSVSKAIHSIQQSDITWMVLDGTQQPSQQDKEISSYVASKGKACIFVINKWDLVEKDHNTFDEICEYIRRDMALLDYVPIISVSALEKTRTSKVLELTQLIFSEYSMRITTHTLNKAFTSIISEYQHPSVGGKRPSPKYITQVATNPPTFVIFTTYSNLVKDSYKRFLTNRLRDTFGFKGAPIVLKFVSSKKTIGLPS